jgi:hypothetical protein
MPHSQDYRQWKTTVHRHRCSLRHLQWESRHNRPLPLLQDHSKLWLPGGDYLLQRQSLHPWNVSKYSKLRARLTTTNMN